MSDEKNESTTVYGSMAEITASSASKVEFAEIDGFEPGKKIRIGSVTAGDIIDWHEMTEGEAKRTAGLRLICKSLVGPEPDNTRYADSPDPRIVMRNIEQFRVFRVKESERILDSIVELNGMKLKDKAAVKKD